MTNISTYLAGTLSSTGGLNAIQILGPSYFDRIDPNRLNKITDDLHSKSTTFCYIKGSMPLRNYLFLTHTPHLLKRVCPNALARLVNRYYWLKKFSVHYEKYDETQRLLQKRIDSIVEVIARDFPHFDLYIIQIIQLHLRRGDNLLEFDD